MFGDDDIIEEAKTSRSRCRHCRQEIEEGDNRFGSNHEGLYGDSQSYAYFHLRCASQRFPDRLLAVLKKIKRTSSIESYDALIAACTKSKAKADSRYPYGERASTGRAKCIKCEQAIAKGEFRVAVEREIVTGSFTTMGAGYLHPACAVEHLNEPNLGELLRKNSKLLAKKDLDELAKLCEAAKSSKSSGAKTAKEAPKKTAAPKPTDDELVWADQLIEKNDARGEFIVTETTRMRAPVNDPRHPELAKRARELEPAARKLWAKELGIKVFSFYRGLPVIPIKLGAKKFDPKVLAKHPWIGGYEVSVGSETTLAELMKHPSFAKVKRLALPGIGMTWEGVRGFCSTEEVKNLESLDIRPTSARAMLLVLSSTRFSNLEQLVLGSNWRETLDPDTRGYDGVAGLPALRTLTLSEGWAQETLAMLFKSPLIDRVKEIVIEIGWGLDVFHGYPFPNLEKLSLRRVWMAGPILKALSSSKSLQKLHTLDLQTLVFGPGAMKVLADKKIFPTLKRVDVSQAMTDSPKDVDLLRARFGSGLIAEDVKFPEVSKKAAAKKTKKA